MSAAGKSRRRAVAVCAALLTVGSAAGMAGCGGDQAPERPAAAATATPGAAAAPTPKSATATSSGQVRSPHLSAAERRQARRQLRRLRKETPRTPPTVVTDSGVIP
jgi:hypothetical protein